MILIYPDKLIETSKVKMILDHLKYPYTYDVGTDHRLVFNSTFSPKHEFRLKTDKFVINGMCNNVLKDNVDKVWAETYGCGLRVNPKQRMGYCVKKTIQQGTNSGEIVRCPCEEEDGYVYLKIADTRDCDGIMSDYRLVICAGRIVLSLIKKKTELFKFRHEPTNYIRVSWADVLTTQEHDSVLLFASKMGLDFGELDVLRSNFDGKIYVVDVNNLSGYGYFRTHDYLEYLSNVFRLSYL